MYFTVLLIGCLACFTCFYIITQLRVGMTHQQQVRLVFRKQHFFIVQRIIDGPGHQCGIQVSHALLFVKIGYA